MKVLFKKSLHSSLAVAVASALVAMFSPACSGEEDPTPVSADKYASLTAFCDTAGVAACTADVQETCGSPDATKCAGDFSAACRRGDTFINFGATTTYNKDAADACVTALTTVIADSKIKADELTTLAEKCGPVFSLRKAAGLQCSSNFDCDSTKGLKCLTSSAGTSTCVVPVDGEAGRSCDAAKTLCPEGFFCDPVVNKCNEQNGANAECYPQFDSCQPDFRCLTSPTDTTKTTCQPKTGLNQPCSSHEECQTGVCEPRVTGDACSNLIDISTQSPECTFFDGL